MDVAVPEAVVIVGPAAKVVVPEGANQTWLVASPELTIETVLFGPIVRLDAKTVSWFVGACVSINTVSVAAVPALPAASVRVTLNVRVPSESGETLIPLIVWFVDEMVPLPVTLVPPPELDIV